jgi:hypothetical protein
MAVSSHLLGVDAIRPNKFHLRFYAAVCYTKNKNGATTDE